MRSIGDWRYGSRIDEIARGSMVELSQLLPHDDRQLAHTLYAAIVGGQFAVKEYARGVRKELGKEAPQQVREFVSRVGERDGFTAAHRAATWSLLARYYALVSPERYDDAVSRMERAFGVSCELEERLARYGPIHGDRDGESKDEKPAQTAMVQFHMRTIEAVTERAIGKPVAARELAEAALVAWPGAHRLGQKVMTTELRAPFN